MRTGIKLLCVVSLLFFAVPQVFPEADKKEPAGDYVVLLHGLGRTRISMRSLKNKLTDKGYHVVSITYPSMKYTVDGLSNYAGKKIQSSCTDKNKKINFITHSLGGIVLRYYLRENKLHNLGRVVMLSPPNKGSEVVDELGDAFFIKDIMGPSGQQLGTSPSSIPNTLGPVDFELGVITGNKSINPLFSEMIPGEDDGTVAVQRAKIEGMKDFLVLPTVHSFIMYDTKVIKQAIYFIENGKFLKEAKETKDE